MKYQIKHRFNGKVLFEAEIGNLKACVELATKGIANLRGADLRGADLCGADLRDANLCGADLRGADLCDANLRDANLRDANLRDANLRGANLCGADLRGANLCGADLRDADLRDANLRGANLRGADLRGADLCDADLRGANLKKCCYLTAGCGGQYRRLILCNPDEDLVQAGCFKDTFEKFKVKVKKDYGDDYGSYAAVVAYLEVAMKVKK